MKVFGSEVLSTDFDSAKLSEKVIVWCEDEQDVVNMLVARLRQLPDTVSLVVLRSMDQVTAFVASKLVQQVKLVITDGNLDSGDRTGVDGARIVEQFRQKNPVIPIFGYSATNKITGIEYPNMYTKFESRELAAAIRRQFAD